jgi:hypothetical protein
VSSTTPVGTVDAALGDTSIMPEEPTTPDPVERTRTIFEASTPRDWDTVLTFYGLRCCLGFTGSGRFEAEQPKSSRL